MTCNYQDVFVTIATKNIEILVNFYTQLFRQSPTVYRNSIYAEFDLKSLRLGIFQPKIDNKEFNNFGSSMSLCIEVENLVEAIATLADLGYPVPGEIIKASHGQEIYAYDPEGNRLILHQSKNTKS
ncbi:glyoxalase/bleomycin resistance protein/dioxygenase [Chondrocystis sp. NIES-4102]|nr:glyoxalase/bleomycin resistance protein/dioxygenase [Chondrocystis sp. NIES-4102]